MHCDCIQSPASDLFRLGVSNLSTLTLFELSKKKKNTKKEKSMSPVPLKESSAHLSCIPASTVFHFGASQYEKNTMTQLASA